MTDKKLIILGMDGLDPKICQQMMDAGDLPHFKQLAEKGGFTPLQTSNPPQTPVAWSDMATGTNAGDHDVFEFLTRNPETYMPAIGLTEIRKKDKNALTRLFSSCSHQGLHTKRKGKTFWDVLGENGIPSTILHYPVTFPAEPLLGKMLSGMGTTDIKGTEGVFSFYTSKPITRTDVQGRVAHVAWNGDKITTVLTGPKVQIKDGTKEIKVPVEIEKIDSETIRLSIQRESQKLKVGDWSDWFQVKFKVGVLKKVSGICRFHLNALDPHFGLYVTPVNIDPTDPVWCISYPDDYAKDLAQEMGFYFTQGIPFDTWAVNEGRINEETFLEIAYQAQNEYVQQMRIELARFDAGALFVYFGISDLIQHMFWRYRDPQHPNKGTNQNPQVKDAIPDVYKHLDGVLAEVMEKMDDNTQLMIVSDHGFGTFRRAAHINSWLRENGYFTLQDDGKEGKDLFQNVDWSRTKAYSLGFGGIYINQFGREKYGVVYKGAESDELKKELIAKLKEWNDKDGISMVKNVYDKNDLYSGPYIDNAPDLTMGFRNGYRASWQTALGAAPVVLIEDNMKAWGGDHLFDPSEVPGVLFSSKKLLTSDPKLMDLYSLILNYFDGDKAIRN